MNNSRIRIKFKRSWLKQGKVAFTPNNVVILFILLFLISFFNTLSIVYELHSWSQDLNTDFTLKLCLFGTV